jgi:hypothetical protein
MAFIKFLTALGLITVFFFGQLLRINLASFSIPIIDIFIVLLAAINFFDHLLILKHQPKNTYFLYFILFAWFSFFINLIFFHYPFLKPIFYLIRLTSLLSFFIYPPSFSKYSKNIQYYFVLSIIANIIFGLIQYFVWPNFTYFNSLNWDPHLYRLVSTFFDPTFTGLIYLFFLIYLYFQKKYWLIWLPYLGLALTYSRSSFLALVIASFFVSLKTKKPLIFITGLLLVCTTIFILPRQPGEGTKLERTSSIKAKIENYQEGIHTFLTSPVIGHGYNNLMYVRKINIPDSHANSGFDSSLLTILCTTGLIGLALFLIGSSNLFRHSSLLFQTLLIALFIHSLFANSLLYPWVLVFLILI